MYLPLGIGDKPNLSFEEDYMTINDSTGRTKIKYFFEHYKDLDENITEVITAPLVGTFYESPKPGEPPFINIGDVIEVGQSLCIIEAMKIFNAIESDYSGEIVEVLVQDGEPVEFGQPLFKFIKK